MTSRIGQEQAFFRAKAAQMNLIVKGIASTIGLWTDAETKYVPSPEGTDQTIVVTLDAGNANFARSEDARIKELTERELNKAFNDPEDMFSMSTGPPKGRGENKRVEIRFTAKSRNVYDTLDRPSSSIEALAPETGADLPAPSERYGLRSRSAFSGLTDVTLSVSDLKRAMARAQRGVDSPLNEQDFRRYIRDNPNLKRLVAKVAEERVVSARTDEELQDAVKEIQDLSRTDVQEGIAFKPKKPVPADKRVYAAPRRFKPLGL